MEKKKFSVKNLIRPLHRTLQVDILSLFLSLFIFSFAFVIFFTYTKHKKAIEEFSLGTVSRVSNIVLEKIKALIVDANRFPTITDSLIWNKSDITIENKDLVLYLLRVIQSENDFSHIFAASKEGNFLGASDLQASSQHNYMTNPSKPLPQEARYSVLYVDNTSKPSKVVWHYIDKNLEPICYEESFTQTYDPRLRPWYEGAMNTKGVYWSDVYTYFATGDKGISVSQPLYDEQGNIFGVTGVDLSFTLLSQFLALQYVGKTGQVFLLHGRGGEELITHGSKDDVHRNISHDAVLAAYRQYSAMRQKAFTFKNDGIQYLAYVDRIPVISGKYWLIMVIVPNADFFDEIMQTEESVTLITLGVLVISALLVYYLSKRISSPIVKLASEVNKIKQLDLASEVRVTSSIKEIILMDTSIAAMRNALRSFARYVPKRIVKQLIEKGEEIALGGEKKEITVFFSDIAGFTSFSEIHSTEVVMTLLSEYFDALSKIIIKEEGIIDKYIGDSIMAFWGAPLEIADHAIRACTAAIHCQAFLSKFNQKREEEGQSPLATRIAMNTGTVIVGNIGTLERMNYTVIGDVVNAAAHLQPVNKVYHTQTIITEETYKKTENRFLVRPLDIIVPIGKKTKIKIFELIGFLQGDASIQATTEQRELCDLFTRGFEAFNSGDLKEANNLFSAIAQKFPNDFPTQIYLKRLKDSLT